MSKFYVSFPLDVGLGLIQLEHFQRGMFYPSLSISHLLAGAVKIAFIMISHSISHHNSGSYNWLFFLVLRRQGQFFEVEKIAKSGDFSFWRASARDSQNKCSALIACTLLMLPRLSVFSSGRGSLCIFRMPSQQLQLSWWPPKHLWPSSLQVSMPINKDI